MIQVADLHKKFGKTQVLDKLDLDIDGGGIFAILGPNGSGKTTLIKSILGMVIMGQRKYFSTGQCHQNQLELSQRNQLPSTDCKFPQCNLKVRELIKMIVDLRQKPNRADELIELFRIGDFLNKKLTTLSGVEPKQKVNIVLSFMFDSPLLILDEPTTGLDPLALINLKKLIQEEKNKGKTILITSHILQFVEEVADEIIYLLEGKIYFKGTLAQLKSKTEQTDIEHAIAAIATQPQHA